MLEHSLSTDAYEHHLPTLPLPCEKAGRYNIFLFPLSFFICLFFLFMFSYHFLFFLIIFPSFLMTVPILAPPSALLLPMDIIFVLSFCHVLQH